MLRLENLFDAIHFQRIIRGDLPPSTDNIEDHPNAVKYERKIVPETDEVIFVPITSQTTLPSHRTPPT